MQYILRTSDGGSDRCAMRGLSTSNSDSTCALHGYNLEEYYAGHCIRTKMYGRWENPHICLSAQPRASTA